MREFLATVCLACFARGGLSADSVIIDFAPGCDLAAIQRNDVKLRLVPKNVLRIESSHSIAWPGITIKAPGGKWDLSEYAAVAMDVRNRGDREVKVGLRIDNEGGTGNWKSCQEVFTIPAGERRSVRTVIHRPLPDDFGFFGMRGYPPLASGYRGGGAAIDPAAATQVIVFVPRPQEDHVFEISRIRGEGTAPALPDKKDVFPFIDRFGQYVHKEWPGKTLSDQDFAERMKEEERDLSLHPGPEGRNMWGGWKDGPKLKATGFFRPEKHEGKWWLVDPDGRLFWSHGIDCVGTWADTVITGREHWHKEFPGNSGELKKYGWESNAREDSHWKGAKVLHFNWAAANAHRKFGPEWEAPSRDLAHRRLKSWGFNTIGNWSDKELCALKRTPYTIDIHWWSRQIEGSKDHPGRFYDAFDPEFRTNIGKRMEAEKGRTAGDPWCVGYFVDNELKWGGDTELAVTTLASPAAQAAKRVFVDDLRKKYGKIAKLNEAWGTSHAGWDALKESRIPPEGEGAKPDLAAFTRKSAAKYFSECREAVRAVAPDNLYLGCRFAGWAPEPVVRAAAENCDVVSYNHYTRDVGWAKLPEGCDRPVLIGEFHFGALDRGMFHTGLQGVENQEERAKAYLDYVTSALENPAVVGTHWFQYRDQSTTGRFDGENYQIGFVDVCDTPYPETIAASREIGGKLYSLRR